MTYFPNLREKLLDAEMMNQSSARRENSKPQSQSITVVIPALNAASTIGSQLQALCFQRDAPHFEVVVVDNGSSDDTQRVVTSLWSERLPVRVVWEPQRGINIARNRGIASAEDGIILICDADDIVSDHWVKELSEAVSHSSWSSGPAFMFEDAMDVLSLDRASLVKTKPSTHLDTLGGNCGFTTSMWKELGGFDERLSGPGDETEFFHRAHNLGFRANFVEAAWIYYRRRPRSRRVIRDSFKTGLHHAKVAQCDGGSYLVTGPPKTYALLRLIRVVLSAVKHIWVSSGRRILLENVSYWAARLVAPRTFE